MAAKPKLTGEASLPATARRPASVDLPVDRLDEVVHQRLRLGILSALAGTSFLTFNDLKETLKATDGNLSRHAQKLEQAGYLSCRKSFRGRLPRTEYRLTEVGRQALERYLDHMEALIRTARSS